MSIKLPATSRHHRDMTERLLKATLSPNQTKSTDKQNKMKKSDPNKPGKKPSEVQKDCDQNPTPPKPSTKQNSNQPKNSQTPGTKKIYAEATAKRAEVNVQETLVTLLSTVKTLLESRINTEGETGDSSVNQPEPMEEEKRKETKNSKRETNCKELIKQKIV